MMMKLKETVNKNNYNKKTIEEISIEEVEMRICKCKTGIWNRLCTEPKTEDDVKSEKNS